MSDETRRRAGEPFFTTKEPGCGMGLGLYLARRVVERLNGNLTIDSALGRGTTVTVRLPLRRVEYLTVTASR
jgi:two-component system sensor histidine kinase RegB